MSNLSKELYQLKEQGRELEAMFFYNDIDEQTLKDSKDFLLAEIENKSSDLVILYQNFENFISKEGMLSKEIERLKVLKKDYEDRFNNFKTQLSECMYSLGMETGKANGIMTDRGVIILSKSSREVPINLDIVEDKYKLYDVTLTVNKEEYIKLKELLNDKVKLKGVKLNKELYNEEIDIEKQHHYSVKVK